MVPELQQGAFLNLSPVCAERSDRSCDPGEGRGTALNSSVEFAGRQRPLTPILSS